MLPRAVTSALLDDLSFFPIVGIIGPRQVGKTTLAKTLATQLAKPTRYIDLELETDQVRLLDAETFLGQHTDQCVIIDEVQRMPQLFPLLRALTDAQREPARFILLGSASPSLLRNSSESLAGRIAYTELSPFSLPEIEVHTSQREHWLRGGFPPALLAPRIEQAFRWLTHFTTTFAQRDLQDLGYEVSAQFLQKLLTMLAQVHGNLLNYSDLARSLGVTQPTVVKYIDLLEGSFLLHRLTPYFVNIGKRLVKAPKLYIRDSGLLHHLTRIRSYDQLMGHPAVGASWEGYVIEQIRRVAGTDLHLHFYRTQVGAETDLVLVSPTGQLTCIEIKLSNAPTVSKGFYQTLHDLNPHHKFILIPDGEGYSKAGGVQVENLRSFLNRLPSLA